MMVECVPTSSHCSYVDNSPTLRGAHWCWVFVIIWRPLPFSQRKPTSLSHPVATLWKMMYMILCVRKDACAYRITHDPFLLKEITPPLDNHFIWLQSNLNHMSSINHRLPNIDPFQLGHIAFPFYSSIHSPLQHSILFDMKPASASTTFQISAQLHWAVPIKRNSGSVMFFHYASSSLSSYCLFLSQKYVQLHPKAQFLLKYSHRVSNDVIGSPRSDFSFLSWLFSFLCLFSNPSVRSHETGWSKYLNPPHTAAICLASHAIFW